MSDMPAFITLHPYAKDIAGQRFGRLTALGPVELGPRGGVRWLYQCECGKTTVTYVLNERTNSRSCGCLRDEMASIRARTHGKTGTRLYKTWHGMITRCHTPNDQAYHHYGARGIKVCDLWRESFEEFEWYVAQLPHFDEKGYSLDRINNDRDYEPDNVQWATTKEQARNRRSNRLLTYNGKTQCLQDWARELGTGKNTLQGRLKAGWSVEDTLGTPIRFQEPRNAVKLSEDDVRMIRREYAAGDVSQTRLGQKYGVQQTGISQIVLRKTWKHVGEQP